MGRIIAGEYGLEYAGYCDRLTSTRYRDRREKLVSSSPLSGSSGVIGML